MTLTREELEKSIFYAERLKITASFDPSDPRLVQFQWSEPIPSGLGEEAFKLLELSIQYYQRTVFTGEYLIEDPNPPVHKTGERIEDINFYLDYYKSRLISEINKAFDLDIHRKKTITEEGRVMTPYVEAMLEHQKKLREKKKK